MPASAPGDSVSHAKAVEFGDAVALFGALLAERENRPAALAAVARAFGARSAFLGARSGEIVDVDRVAAGARWPLPGTRLRVGRGSAGLVRYLFEGNSGRALGIASDGAAGRPAWLGEAEIAAILESLAALEREADDVGRREHATNDGIGQLAAVARERAGGSVLELAVAGTEALEDRLGSAAARAALDGLESRLRALVRRADGFFVLGPGRFAVHATGDRDAEEVAAFGRRLEAIVGFPLRAEGEHFALSARLRRVPLERLRSWAENEPTSATLDPLLLPLESERVPPLATAHGYLAAYQPIFAPDGRTLRGAEALIRRIHPRYGVLAPERLGTVAADERERLELAHWLSAEAAARVSPKGLNGLCVNLCSLSPASVRSFVGSERFGEYHMKGLRFELTARQLESAATRSGLARETGDFAVSSDASISTEALTRRPGLVSEIVLHGPLLGDVSIPRTQAAFVRSLASLAASHGATLRVRGFVGRALAARLGSLGVASYQPAGPVLAASDLLGLERAGESA